MKLWLNGKKFLKRPRNLFLYMVLHLTRLPLILSTVRSVTSAFMIRLIHTSLFIWMGMSWILNNSFGWLQRLSRLISCLVCRKNLLWWLLKTLSSLSKQKVPSRVIVLFFSRHLMPERRIKVSLYLITLRRTKKATSCTFLSTKSTQIIH